jgi:hypothetical protein
MIPQMQQQQQPPMFQSATDNSKIKMHITDFFFKKKTNLKRIYRHGERGYFASFRRGRRRRGRKRSFGGGGGAASGFNHIIAVVLLSAAWSF